MKKEPTYTAKEMANVMRVVEYLTKDNCIKLVNTYINGPYSIKESRMAERIKKAIEEL